jgi:nucleotide-binding universal stress UspA family protein
MERPPVNRPAYNHILFCTDYSEDAESAFDHAYDQAKKHNAKLHIMNVIASVNPCNICTDQTLSKEECQKESREKDERRRLEELGALKKVYMERCQDLKDCCFVVRVGSPDVEIIKYADENSVDMIIMGTAGRNEKKRLIYIKTAANVSKYANCQVITIGSPEEHQTSQPTE